MTTRLGGDEGEFRRVIIDIKTQIGGLNPISPEHSVAIVHNDITYFTKFKKRGT